MTDHLRTDVGPWTMVPDALLDDERLTMADRMVYIALRSFVIEKDVLSAHPSMSTLAVRAGVSKSTAKRAVRNLEDRGWLTVTRVRREDGLNHNNEYVIHHQRVVQEMHEGWGHSEPRVGSQGTEGVGSQRAAEEEPSFEEEPIKKNPPTPHTPPTDLDAEWNEVWSWWPKHGDAYAARKAYRSQMRNYGQSRVEIIQGIKFFADHFDASGQAPTFCPRLSGWLTDERWRDWANGPPKGHDHVENEKEVLTMEDLIAAENNEGTT